MPVLIIDDATFSDLESLAIWLGMKTPSNAVEALVLEKLSQLNMEAEPADGSEPVELNSVAEYQGLPEDLAFAKPLKFTADGSRYSNASWAKLLRSVIKSVKIKNGFTAEQLVHELGSWTTLGHFEAKGFSYDDQLGISIQGQSAADVWKKVDGLARRWKIPVSVEFHWPQHSESAYAGKSGILRSYAYGQ